MAHRTKIRSCILLCTYLMAMPSGQDALSCCRRDFTNSSSSFELSDRPGPSCDTQWSADGTAVVDESGGVDESRVHHAGSQSIILRGNHTRVIFRMDCALKKSMEVYCNVLCRSSDEFSPTTEMQHTRRPNNAANRSTSDGIIFIIFIIFIFVT
ncbi:hypothetical protein G5714_019168 [Onychostoma macrolepis]|uniref:Uncharacterized protein n=1 Tax=Onychostoma macrolepis TaxID=369639 RepID=A0A7J6C557_9TELE|nr:hypothetical protein G5714_019168 [Onychostoma macrolepis]